MIISNPKSIAASNHIDICLSVSDRHIYILLLLAPSITYQIQIAAYVEHRHIYI